MGIASFYPSYGLFGLAASNAIFAQPRKPLGNNWEAHHAHSVAAGGHDGLSNCVAMCPECHRNTHTYGRS